MELVSIPENKLFTQIDGKIFIKKNFITEESYSSLLQKAKSLTEEEWDTHPTDEKEGGRISTNMHETLAVSQELIECIIPKYWINEHKTINRMRNKDEPLPFGWNPWSAADYCVVFYFGDFKGGNLRKYKDSISDEFTLIEIETNVLYLLPIANEERYVSESVEEGTKYSFVDWIYRHPEWALP
jgi:hypothetical protein